MRHYYLDPAGDDASDGSAARPWRSLAAAVARVRQPTTLHLRGEHRLEAPLTIGAAHQGLVLQAWDDVAPTLTSLLELAERRGR